MDVTVRGRNLEVSESIRSAASDKVARLSRFLDGMTHAEVHFFEQRNRRIAEKAVCEVTILGHGHIVRARAASPDTSAALDRAVDKLEHQLTRLKGKLLARSHPRRYGYPSVQSGHDPDADADQIHNGDDDDVDMGGRIVKTKQFAIKPMTPEEAALQMDLLGHDFFFFTNAETERAAVVYRRGDGDVGLIDAS